MKHTIVLCLILLFLSVFSGCEKTEKKKVEAEPEVQSELIDENQTDDGSEMESATEYMGEGQPEAIEFEIEQSTSYRVGDAIALTLGDKALYELTIDEITYTELRDEYAEDPGNVILVTYTYKNLSEEMVFIDDMSFQMMLSDEQTILSLYYPGGIQVPEPVAVGDSCTAQVAYAVPEKADSVVLVYHDIVNTDIQPVKIVENNLNF